MISPLETEALVLARQAQGIVLRGGLVSCLERMINRGQGVGGVVSSTLSTHKRKERMVEKGVG